MKDGAFSRDHKVTTHNIRGVAMNKQKAKKIIEDGIKNKMLFRYWRKRVDFYSCFGYFCNVGSDLAMVIDEDDFIFDGYHIIRLRDITEIEPKNDYYDYILEQEGLKSKIVVPKIRLDSWQTVLEDLQSTGKNVIIESESLEKDKSQFGIGKIIKTYKTLVHLKHFDADGIWDDGPTIIPYNTITKVIFDSRYVSVFSKYTKEQ
jgi:hypothetical protein